MVLKEVRDRGSRKGGGKLFQHLVAAYLKLPRKAAELCLGIRKGQLTDRQAELSSFRHFSFSNKYFGRPVFMIPKSKVARWYSRRRDIFKMPAALRLGVTCVRGGTLKQKRAQAFCTRCTTRSVRASRRGPYTRSAYESLERIRESHSFIRRLRLRKSRMR